MRQVARAGKSVISALSNPPASSASSEEPLDRLTSEQTKQDTRAAAVDPPPQAPPPPSIHHHNNPDQAMTQANASRQQSSDASPLLPDASLLEDGSGEFYFELDSFLQWVTDFDRESKGSSSSSLAAAPDAGASGGESVGATSERRVGDTTLRDGDASEMLLAGSVATPNFSGIDDNQQQGSAMRGRSYRKLHSLDDEDFVQTQSPFSTSESMNLRNDDECSSAQSPPHHQTSEEDEGVASTTTGKAPKKRNQNLSRKRQREEIEHLRVSVKELQSQLEMLLSGDSTYCSVLKKKDRQEHLLQALAWKRAAAIEKLQSELASVENLKLRTRVNKNLLICKSVRDTCSKYRFIPSPNGNLAFGSITLKKPIVNSALSDSATFSALCQGLDDQYKHLSAIWGERNFKNVEKEKPSWLRSEDDYLFLEHAKSHMFPFTPEAVTRATWKLMQGGLLTPTNGELEVRQVMENTMYATLTDKIPLLNAHSTVKLWIALRRFIEDHQVVIVWRAVVEIEHSKKIRMAERGWNVVRSIANSMEENQRGLVSAPCVSHTCIRTTSETKCAAGEDELDAGSLTARVMSQYYQNMTTLDQTIESLLLDESFTSGGCGDLGESSSASGSTARQWNVMV